MIVVGIDPHKQTHTAVALDRATGAKLAELTVKARTPGFERLVAWARGLDQQRRFAVEDGRHVAGALELHLIARGERCVRVPPRMMGEARRTDRVRGKSDPIDAAAVARAALAHPDLPEATLAGPEREIGLLWRTGSRWFASGPTRSRSSGGSCTTSIPISHRRFAPWAGSTCWIVSPGCSRRCSRRCRPRSASSSSPGAGRSPYARTSWSGGWSLVKTHAQALLQIPGCGALNAAKIVAETAQVSRFPTEGHFARYSGTAPVPASSGATHRHRLNRRGNRQLNAALHRIAVTQIRIHQSAKDYLAKKRSEGMSKTEATRALKRLLSRVVFKTMMSMTEPTDRLTAAAA